MDAAEFLALLVRAALGATAALALIAMLRRPLRRAFGPSVAYGVWVLLPAMVLAAALSRTVSAMEEPAIVQHTVTMMPGAMEASPIDGAAIPVAVLLLACWGVGASVYVVLRLHAQRRWRQSLGPLRTEGDGLAWAAANAGLPAVVGWPRARVVLPDDFAGRFSAAEQELVLAHERRHLARGDLHAQLVLELLRAALWFHPLLPWAARALRHDQELACDAEVLATRPFAANDYARALLRAAAIPMPPLATAWGFSHPLKERLAMLQQAPLSPRARRFGVAAICALVALASAGAWAALPRAPGAAGPVPEGKLRQTWTLQIDGGETIGPMLLVDDPGVPVEIRFEHAGETWTLSSAATALADGRFEVRGDVKRGDAVVSSPRLVIGAEGGTIAFGEQVAVDQTSGALDVRKGVRADVRVEAGEGAAVAGAVPRYPPGAAKAGAEGTVILRVDVSAEGRVTDVRIERSSGHASLDDAAMARVREWTFTPGKKDGEPVAGQMLVPIEFRADDEPTVGN